MTMHAPTPIVVSFRARPPASLAALEGVPSIEVDGDRFTFTADSMRQAYDGLVALVRVATREYAGLLFETVMGRPDGEEIMAAFSRALEKRWFEVESGQWQETEQAPPAGTKYHGYR